MGQSTEEWDDKRAGQLWEENAEAWTVMSRAGYDVCRDLYNTPAFMEMLPDVVGLLGLDLGCGEGHNTRLVASRGARLIALDIAPTFVRAAHDWEVSKPQGIHYLVASGWHLPFPSATFDFVTAFMAMMDIPHPEKVVLEVNRVLKPGGFFQFSMTHPCFSPPRYGWLDDEAGNHVARVTGDYYREGIWTEEWIFGAAPAELKAKYRKFRTAYWHLTLSSWVNTLVDAGFRIERMCEPLAGDEVIAAHPYVADSKVTPLFLQIRCRKP
jgi:ubiquinone/menaquinone biosynthesis C-methylase UbiE